MVSQTVVCIPLLMLICCLNEKLKHKKVLKCYRNNHKTHILDNVQHCCQHYITDPSCQPVFTVSLFFNLNKKETGGTLKLLTLSNPIFLPTAYSPALICFGRERGW
jgi:hypothetical protein